MALTVREKLQDIDNIVKIIADNKLNFEKTYDINLDGDHELDEYVDLLHLSLARFINKCDCFVDETKWIAK